MLCFRKGCLLDTPGQILLEALERGDREVAHYILAISDRSIFKTVHHETGDTALHFAVAYLDVELTHLLIEGGADANVLSINDVTPLHNTLFYYQPGYRKPVLQMVRLLLDYNADPFSVDDGYGDVDTAQCICEESRDYDIALQAYDSAFSQTIHLGSVESLQCMRKDYPMTDRHLSLLAVT